MIWAGGYFARISDGRWYRSPQDLSHYGKYPLVRCIAEDSSVFSVPSEEVLDAILIRSQALWKGQWFGIGSIWTLERERIYEPIPASSQDFRVVLFYGASENYTEVAALPGVTVLNDRGTNGGITVTVSPAEVTACEDQVEHFAR